MSTTAFSCSNYGLPTKATGNLCVGQRERERENPHCFFLPRHSPQGALAMKKKGRYHRLVEKRLQKFPVETMHNGSGLSSFQIAVRGLPVWSLAPCTPLHLDDGEGKEEEEAWRLRKKRKCIYGQRETSEWTHRPNFQTGQTCQTLGKLVKLEGNLPNNF